MKKLAAILAVVGLGLAGFAGTCNLLQTSLTQIGATDTYAGALQNNTGANFLGHAFKVTFVDAYGNIIDQRTNVSGCLRSWQNGTSDFFSVASTQPAASTVSAIASLDYSQPLVAGSTLATSSTVTGVTASLNGTTLTVAGTLRNNDAVTMVSPNVCAVVYNSSGNITVTQVSSLGSLSPSTSTTFTMSITVPGGTVSSNTVTVWADGLENNIPTTPIQSVSTAVSTGASRLAFTTQPSTSSTGGVAFASQPVVTLYDVNNNVLTGSTASVTLTLSGGTAGAVLTCNQAANTVTAVNGVATFSGCKINLANPSPATAYVLTASSLGATGAVSDGITISVGPAAQVGFTTQPPTTIAANAPFGAIAAIQDLGGNTISGSTAAITLDLFSNPGGATLTGCTTAGTSSGQATFTGCTIANAANGYQLLASSGSLSKGVSTVFNVTPLPQTIAFSALSNQLLTTGTYSIAGKATASSGLAVTYSSLTPATCTVSGSTVTLVATGTCTIQASQAGNATYSAAPSVTQSFIIS